MAIGEWNMKTCDYSNNGTTITQPDWQNEEPVFTVLYSAKHDFLYHPEFHPDKAGQIMMEGWRAIIKCELGGKSSVCDCVLGLNREGTENSAREFAKNHVYVMHGI